jgi:hypothetical protein
MVLATQYFQVQQVLQVIFVNVILAFREHFAKQKFLKYAIQNHVLMEARVLRIKSIQEDFIV